MRPTFCSHDSSRRMFLSVLLIPAAHSQSIQPESFLIEPNRVPRQYSTGGKARLYGISKRGNNYLRKILIHGARAVVLRSKRDRIAIGDWMTALEARAPRNVLIVATANKLARIAWAVLSSGQDYRAVQDPVPA
jgi:hypothetical protein